MGPAFIACASELVSRWEDSMGTGKEKEIDVWPELQDLTGDVISRAAFGSSLTEGRRIFRIQSEQVQLATHMSNLHIPGYTYLGDVKEEWLQRRRKGRGERGGGGVREIERERLSWSIALGCSQPWNT
ncbi:hypothetical protein EJB05_17735, partial [Eragrostis curvula]